MTKNINTNTQNGLSKLISHRIRGFDQHDATKAALINALEKDVDFFEIDLRISKDRHLILNHDPHLLEHYNNPELIANLTLAELKQLANTSGTNGTLLSFNEFLDTIESCNNKNISIAVEIKEYGEEKKIVKALEKRNLINQTVIVTWIPEVIYSIAEMNKYIKLCFTHLPLQNGLMYTFIRRIVTSNFLKKLVMVAGKLLHINTLTQLSKIYFHFESYNNNSESLARDAFYNFHFVNGYLEGRMCDLLIQRKGWVCVPYRRVNKPFVEHYRKLGIATCVFSINKRKQLEQYAQKIHPDFIVTDNPALFKSE